MDPLTSAASTIASTITSYTPGFSSAAPLRASLTRLPCPSLPRSSHTLSVLGNFAYLFGGELAPRQPVDNAMHILRLPTTPATSANVDAPASTPGDLDDYRAIAASNADDPDSLPTPRLGLAAASIADSLYVFSGRGGADMSALDEAGALWRFSRPAHTWTKLTPADPSAGVPPPRSYHAAAATPLPGPHGTVFVHGGCLSSGGRAADLWAFDVGARAWSQLPPLPGSGRGGAGLACVAGDRLVAFGGFDGQREIGGRVEVLALSASGSSDGEAGRGRTRVRANGGAWKTLLQWDGAGGADGPVDRSVAGVVAIKLPDGQDGILVLGGETSPSSQGHAGAGKFLSDAWVLPVPADAGTEEGAAAAAPTWRRVELERGAMGARGWAGVAATSEGDGAVVFGGVEEGNARLGDGWVVKVI